VLSYYTVTIQRTGSVTRCCRVRILGTPHSMGTQAGTPTYFELRRSSGSGLHREEMLDVRNSPYPRIARRPISYGSSGITGTEDVNLEGYRH